MSIKIFENGRSPYDKVIFSSPTAMENKRRHTCNTSFPTSSSLPHAPSGYALPEHSYSAPVLYTSAQRSNVDDSTPDINVLTALSHPSEQIDARQQIDDSGEIKTTVPERKILPSDLPKITTHFVQEPQVPSELPKKGPQHQRVASEDDTLSALATLPSPATSVHDFPAAHHIKHAPVRKISSSSLNADVKDYPHHLSPSEGRLQNSVVENIEHKGNHDNNGPILDHHTFQKRLSKFGLAKSTELIGHYAILRTIGAGSFSKVKSAIDLNSCRKVAIKMITTKGIQDSERLRASVMREVEILKYIDHPNIVGLLDTVETPTHLCLVLEYVPGGELFDYINDHYEDSTEEESKYIFLQLVKSLDYLHENGIVHRDLKLENILIESSNPPNGPIIKLTDFGLAKFIDKSSPILTTRCGSEEYAAPELISGKPYDGRKTDIWSLGVILYTLLVGYLPFNLEPGQSRQRFFGKIISADFTFPNSEKETDSRRSKISKEAKDLVKKILQNNHQKRPSLDEIRNHPWLKNVSV